MSKLLQSNAMLTKLSISNWPAMKNDKRITEQVAQQYDAEKRATKVVKRLIDKDSLKAIRNAIAKARTWHNGLTLPWGDHGERLLPVGIHELYVDRIEDCIEKLEAARRSFLDQYSALIEEARQTLGQMFNEDDYPSHAEAAAKFGISYESNPVPSGSHFVADLGDAQAEKIKADVEKRTQIKLDNAVVQLYERIEEGLRRLVDRLGIDEDGKPKRIHKTALETMQQIADLIPSMNLTSDPQLTEIGRRIREALEHVQIDDLRYKSQKTEAKEMVNLRREKLSKELDTIASAYFGSPSTADA